MPTLTQFTNQYCPDCQAETLHNGVCCVGCKRPIAKPVARDIAAFAFGGQSREYAERRLAALSARRADTCADSLKPEQREIMTLYAMGKGRTHIAAELKIDPTRVSNALERCRKVLRLASAHEIRTATVSLTDRPAKPPSAGTCTPATPRESSAVFSSDT